MNGRLFLALAFVLFFGKLAAQQFGAFPPSTPWQQIDTDTARIIFTKKVDPQAQRIAAIIHRMARQDKNSLGGQVRKIHVLLHPNTTLANGYVALAPFRSEYYLIPGSNIFESGATPWNEELAVHEYRHVQQYSNFNKGLSKAAGFVFGQQGQALFNALAVPDWFFEGDAVHAETALTAQGRGRAPWFFNGYRALWHDQREYSWMKLRNGSLKDYVPNHYNLGYLLTNYGYRQYGADFWGKVTDDASRFRSLFYPFQNAVKRVSGKDFKTFRSEALEYYKHEVSTRRDQKLKHETVTNYLFPAMIGNDSLLYLKTAYNKIPAFYIKDGSGEHRLKQRNITSEDWLAYRNGSIAYTAYSVNPRWGLTDYSDIYLLEIAPHSEQSWTTEGRSLRVKTRSEKKITNHGRYFTPDFSQDGSTLIAVSFNDSADNELHLLSVEGNVLQRIKPQKEGDLFVHPRFAGNGSVIVAVRHADATMSLQRLTLEEGSSGTSRFETILAPTATTIGYPFVTGETVYFVSSAMGNDDIFSLDLNSRLPVTKLTQLTAGVTGNYFPSVGGDNLFYSNFTSNGFKIGHLAIAPLRKSEIGIEQFTRRVAPYPVAYDSGTPNLLSVAGAGSFSSKPYKKTTGLFNFHSRQANYSDPEITGSIFSDNILNTFSNEIFYRYNRNESSHAVGFTSYYGGFFPVLNAGFTYTANRNLRTTTRTYTLDQKEARLGYYIPLNFSGGKLYKNLSFGTDFVLSQTTPTGSSKNFIQGLRSNYLSHFINFSEQLPRAVQHLFPKLGYAVSLSHRHLLGNAGYQFLGGARLYLPSVKNHSMVVAANWQETDTSNVVFSNRFANSRGYNDYFFSRMWRLTGNYHMPLLYPDWGFGNIVYFLRVRGNAFYDYTRVYSRNKLTTRHQRSVGGEIYFDTRWWNALPVSFGFRMSHLLDDDFSGMRPKGSNFFEFILPVDLIPR
jgi:Tol biopolymer transport system component